MNKRDLPKRKQNRLPEYDYSKTGCYFVTICTYHRQRLFKIEPPVGNNQCVVPCLQNDIIRNWINKTQIKYPNAKFDKYVIMPDHLHFIIRLTERHAGRSLPDVMRYFKSMTTAEYIRRVKNENILPFNGKLWQKSFYDHIIRNQTDYNEIYEYIENNPKKWYLNNRHKREAKP